MKNNIIRKEGILRPDETKNPIVWSEENTETGKNEGGIVDGELQQKLGLNASEKSYVC